MDDPAGVADLAQEQDLAGADSAQPQEPAVDGSAHPQDSAVDDLARDEGPVAQGTPAENTSAAVQDASMVSDISSLLFPSLLRNIDQANSVDFMSMWTLMQRRMDLGSSHPVQTRWSDTYDQKWSDST